MKKKRRMLLFAINFAAAGLAVASAWLQWWGDAWSAKTDFTQLLTSVSVDPTNFLPFSVAMVIFVAAGLMLLAGLTAWKLFGLLGAIIGGVTIVLWFVNSGVTLDFSNLNLSQINIGVLAMAAATTLAFVAIFIPKRREKLK